MTILDLARTTFEARRKRTEPELVVPYDAALERAVTLAPAFRADREALEAIAPCLETPALPPRVRGMALVVITGLCAISPVLVASASVLSMLLGALFGLAISFSGDRIGAAVRLLSGSVGLDRSGLLGLSLAVAELAAVVSGAAVASGSAWSATGLLTLAAAAAALGYLTRTADVHAEQRELARLIARRKLDHSEQAIRQAIDALRSAHAADLSRLAAQMGHAPSTRDVEAVVAR
ncbi:MULTISPECIES: hypothetical protein [unclassified Bradyrhizobium]|uniref:hypothetical protein n=1 Tax=unclassified Bradyrhizobium TaxID=2631580 RepID=UPI0028EA10D6|nr:MULTISPECIES: hypothetical protein [unclassified Bradyrhizobium]